MTKVMALGVVLAALTLASPSKAQVGFFHLRDDWNDRRRIEQQIERLERAIEKAEDQSWISWDEERSLRERLRKVDRLFAEYQWSGLTHDEHRQIAMHLRLIRRDLYRADIWNYPLWNVGCCWDWRGDRRHPGRYHE